MSCIAAESLFTIVRVEWWFVLIYCVKRENIIDYWLINQTIKAIQYELIDVLSLPKKIFSACKKKKPNEFRCGRSTTA
jgi:hypothetical protein